MKGDQLVMVGSECLIGMSLRQAKQVLEKAPGIVEVVAQRKESLKQSPPLVPKSEAGKENGESSRNAKMLKQEETREEAEEKKRLQDKDRETQFTEFLPTPQKQQHDSSQPPRFRRSTSQSDMWTMEAGSGASTSLGYASTTNLSASLNISRPGLQTHVLYVYNRYTCMKISPHYRRSSIKEG